MASLTGLPHPQALAPLLQALARAEAEAEAEAPAPALALAPAQVLALAFQAGATFSYL